MALWLKALFVTCLAWNVAIDLSWAQSMPKPSKTQSLAKVPSIINVGVIPSQVMGTVTNQNGYLERLSESFPQVVRESKRFRVLSDDLTSSLWDSKEGRQELKKDFELDAFVALSVAENGDLITLNVQLLDPGMQPYVAEMEHLAKDKMVWASGEETKEQLQNIVFRLINRLPIDVTVTSIQGPFLTLSGGRDQALEAGDQLALTRATIKSLHPANKTWLEYSRLTVGKAVVIETKSQTSIAKIINQTFDGAIQVGDGAKVANIASRRKFAYSQENNTFQDAGTQNSVLVPPELIENPPPAPKREPQQALALTPPPTKADDANKETVHPEPVSSPATQSPSSAANEENPANKDEKEESVWDNFSSEASSHKIIETLTAYAGPYWWSVRGPTNSSGRFPIYLLNHFGAGINRTMFYKIKLQFGGGGLFGNTPKGSYLGYDAFSNLFWEDQIAGEFLTWWSAGVAGSFSGINVPKGSYGGGDWIRGGFFGGVGGLLNMGELSSRIDWFSQFRLTPLNIGRVGYDGSFKQVESSLGWRLELGGFLSALPQDPQFGGMILVGDERQTLKNGRRPHFQDYGIKALIKFPL